MKKVTFQLETLACPSCSEKISAVLRQTPGVATAEVLFNSSRAKVTYDESAVDTETIQKRIRRLGYVVLSEKQG